MPQCRIRGTNSPNVGDKCYQQADLIALKSLYEAIQAGKIKREATDCHPMELPALNLAE